MAAVALLSGCATLGPVAAGAKPALALLEAICPIVEATAPYRKRQAKPSP